MALLAEREALQVERDLAVAQAAGAQAKLSDTEALIAHLQLMIGKRVADPVQGLKFQGMS